MHVPPWGIDVHTAQEVPRDVKCLGLRAFYVERAEGPGENCYRVRVDRVSDARFERMALLGFLDRDDADGAAVAFETNEMSYLHQHMFWRVSMREGVALPEVGEKLVGAHPSGQGVSGESITPLIKKCEQKRR